MPLPNPKKDETKEEWDDRCMANPTMNEEFPDNDQRYVVCSDLWRKHKEEKAICHEVERRCFPGAELRLEGAEGEPVIVGHAAVFDKFSVEFGGFKEKIAKGAFARAIKEGQDVRALVDHQSHMILGRTKAGTLELAEDDVGLAVRIKPPQTQVARDVMESIKREDMNQMSFAFRVRDPEHDEHWEHDADSDIRTLLNVDLEDVSVVTYPAYPDTDVAVAMRSRDAWRESVQKDEEATLWRMRMRLRLAEEE